jgi:hypothetical protein
MELLSTYLYFWGSLVGMFLFFYFYFLRKDLRKEMITSGIIIAILGMVVESVFFQDYWTPPLLFRFGPLGGLEDLLFGFSAGSVGAVLYKVIFHKYIQKKRNPHFWIVPFMIITELIFLFVVTPLIKVNSIYTSALGFIIPAIIICTFRKDLIIESILSAVIGGSILIIGEAVMLLFNPDYLQKYFHLHGKVILILGLAPVTELIWGMAFAALIGPMFDFEYGYTLTKMTKKNKKRRSSK